MKFRIPVAYRIHEGLVVAQALAGLRLSAAGASEEDAKRRLSQALAATLGRLHPRRLAGLHIPFSFESQRLDVPVFEVDLGPFTRDGAEKLALPVDIVSARVGEQFQLVGAPQYGAWMWLGAGESTEHLVERLDSKLSGRSRTARLHGPAAELFRVEELELEFEPVDVGEVELDNLWLDALPAEGQQEQADGKLDEVAESWTTLSVEEQAQRGIQPMFDHADSLDQLEELLRASEPAAVVLVGPHRVGKTSHVRHLAAKWAAASEGNAPQLWFADSPRLVSADVMSGGWQQQAASVIEELSERGDVLYMGRLVQALDAGKYFGSDYNLAQFLKPQLAERKLRIVAEATTEEWTRIEQRDVGFARAFSVVRISDPSERRSLEIVKEAARRMASQEGLALKEAAIDRAWALQKRFATEGSPVGRTLDFLARTLRRASQTYLGEVDAEWVVERFCEETGLPEVLLLDSRTLDLDDVKARLRQHVMGQEQAISRVANVVGITKAGLAPADRPLGSFMFIGPTGVGKTELARALADFLFGDRDRLIRLDMSEYSHPDAYSRLIGEGSEQGELTGPVRRQPFSVVLLDEVEKAHTSVFDLLLQVLGEARLTDAQGRTTRFQNTIVIMTSNLGVETLKSDIGFADGDTESAWQRHFRREAEKFFRPEFFARIDQFIPFQPLSRDVIESIAERELERLRERDGAVAQNVQLSFEPGLVEWVAREGYDERYGARPLKRVVEQQVGWRLARSLASSDRELRRSNNLHASIGVDDTGVRVELTAPEPTDELTSRDAVLEQVEEIAEMRRRLQRYMYGELFTDLEWKVSEFDMSSQSADFWNLPDAAEMAREAEEARKIIDPAADLARELAAIEDLAREAYHTRSFELATDIEHRLSEIGPRIEELFLTVLRSGYTDPDRAVLFLASQDPQDPWRKKLVHWYHMLAHQQGWEIQLYRSLPRQDQADVSMNEPAKVREGQYEQGRKASGVVVALEIEGRGVRALLQPDDGLHRKVAEDGNAVIDVVLGPPDTPWIDPDLLQGESETRQTARTWNFRTGMVTMQDGATAELDEDNPWRQIFPVLRELAWGMTESMWW
jgi:ATP-dependent Clp protease ATP-binding subunit ClpA